MSDPRDHPETPRAALRAFLLCDIRGYSTFTSLRGDEATAALTARFAQIASDVMPAYDGEIIGMHGDEVLAVFTSARAAIRAAVQLQGKLLEATTEDDSLPLPAGIGLDFGEAIVSRDGWSANAINVASRLCSIATAGEILATQELVHVAQTMDGIAYVQRNAVEVKGIPRPVQHVRVVSETGDPSVSFRLLGVTGAASKHDGRRRRRRLVLGAAAVAAVLVAVASAAATASSHQARRPLDVGVNAVGELDAHMERVHRRVSVGTDPGAVAADGSAVWVVNPPDGTVSRVDLNDPGAPADTIQVGEQPSAIATGAGATWVTNEADRSVTRINTGAPPRVGDTIGVGNGPSAVAFGFGLVWVTNRIDDTVSVIDPQSGPDQVADRVVATLPIGVQPDAITTGFGSIWVANAGTATVSRIDPVNRLVTASVRVGNGPAALTSDARGVWAVNELDDTISLIDPSSDSVSATLHVGKSPISAATNGQQLWIANSNDDTISEIDPAALRVIDTVHLANAPAGIQAVGRSLWVSERGASDRHRGGTLRIVDNDALQSLDPATAYSTFAWDVLAIMYDGLVTYQRTAGPGGAVIVPDLAARMPEQSSDGLTYTFELRQGLRYSNGAQVKASDFRASMERDFRIAKMPPYFNNILGADACTSAPATCDLSRGVITDDTSGTIVLKLSHADPDLLYKLALPFGSLLPGAVPAKDQALAALPATGPYQLSSAAKGMITLARNPNFAPWSAQAQPEGYPDRIEISINPSTSPDAADTDVADVVSGKYDWTPDFDSPRQLTELVRTRTAQVHPYSDNSVHYFFLNTTTPPFNDVRVRRAVNLAVDRKAAVAALGGPLAGTPACQLIAPSLFGYRPYCPYTANAGAGGQWTAPDLERARALVRAAGAAGSHVTVLTSKEDPGAADVLVHALKAIGITATARVFGKPGPPYYDFITTTSNKVQAALEGWVVDYPEPSNLFVPLLRCDARAPGQTLDESMFCDAHIDKDMDSALRLQAADPAAAGEAWARIDRNIDDHAPWVPLTNARRYDVVSTRVGNYQHHPEFGMLIDQAWVQ